MKKILTGLLVVGLLSGCSEAEVNQKYKKEESSVKSSEKYDLVYSEMIADGDDSEGLYEIAYKDNGVVKYIYKEASNYYERILKDPNQKPFMTRKSDTNDVYIFRQPYMIYNNEKEFTTEVKDKSVIK
ncbi:hypothetical protein [Macrococcus capreoli]|uniref:hypothetical protein n=1 Tax=Macrococcus capreoli TaxID=2982690 RepID=UPI0021D5D738|nr:hypothetical protein [Macrococcus sp. TMW 2.2395]MCU7557270.1 hypothetical protein [Macrococcus sp. TMW 2.2395]